MKQLTDKQKEVAKLLLEYPEVYRLPTLQSVVRMTSVKSAGGVRNIFDGLMKKGYLDKNGHITAAGKKALLENGTAATK